MVARRCRHGGKIHQKAGSFSNHALDLNESSVALDDAHGGGQSQPCPLARFLGREEGIEDLFENMVGNASAGVGDGEKHVWARGGFEEQPRVLLIEDYIGGGERQTAAAGHGVAGINAEVHQYLIELGRVPENGP